MQLFPTSAQTAGPLAPAVVTAVAAGGVIGSTLRWILGNAIDTPTAVWPWPTFIENLLGCLLIGIAATHLERGTFRWNFVITGMLGGFTTMSSFAVELNDFVDADRAPLGIAYGAATLVGGTLAVFVTYRPTSRGPAT